MKVLAIDPSLLHCGWAVLQPRCVVEDGIQLLSYGTIKAPSELKEKDLVERIAWVLGMLDKLSRDVDKIVIEQPESWGAYKSLASSHSGSLLMLHILTGAIVGWALVDMENGRDVVLVKVSAYRGQLPKEVCAKRMREKFNATFQTNDESDATFLGDWYLTQQMKGTK